MSSSPPATFAPPLDPSAEKRLAEVKEQLRKLERRDWWLWSTAIIVMLLLTFAVFSMSFPGLAKVDDPFFQFSLNQSVRGLIGLVLLFNTYTIYQQVAVKRLRRQFSEQLDEMRVLQIRAEEFHRMALVDPLTGLYNRRVAEERLASEASRSQRYGHPLAVVSFDLDKFKEINDTYGHLAGDQVLKEFAGRLGQAIRMSDFAARMGGDEFLVLLPECSTNQVETFLAICGSLDNQFRNFHLAGAERNRKGSNNSGVEFGARTFVNDFLGFERRDGFAVRAIARQCVVDVSDSNDARP